VRTAEKPKSSSLRGNSLAELVSKRVRDPWGVKTRSSCCGGDVVLVDEAAEQVALPRPKILRLRVGSGG